MVVQAQGPDRPSAGVGDATARYADQLEELRASNRRLNAQVAVSRILVEQDRVEEALPLLMETLCAVFDWEIGVYWFNGPAGLERGYVFPEEGLEGELLQPAHPEGLVARAAEQSAVCWANAPGEVQDLPHAFLWPEGNAFAIPVPGERLHGVLLFSGRTRLPAEHALLEVLAAIGGSFGRFVDRRILLAGISRARDAALAASQAKSQFLANVSHELRTPLNAVMGFADLLLTESLTPVQGQRAREIKEAGRGLLRMVNTLLEYGQFQSRRVRLETNPFALTAFLDSLADLARPELEGRDIQVAAEVDAALPRWVVGDEGRLRQALMPLLDNAVRFTRQGRILLRARLVAQEGPRLKVAVEVEDTGPGIPPAQLERVHLPFVQADGSDTRRHGGLGLGLALAKEVATTLEGQLDLWSEEGTGTRATLLLELEEGQAPAPPTQARAPLTGKILVVEDNPINQLVATSLLSALGLSTEVAEDGAKALTKLAEGGFDLVLMDCQMPVMDGWEATRRYRATETTGRIPIVALTASSTEDDMGRCKACGMDDFLAKPIDLEVLSGMLRKHLNQ
jgi:signal transduction histidine kinase/ActR/RegA family two-component response regulator